MKHLLTFPAIHFRNWEGRSSALMETTWDSRPVSASYKINIHNTKKKKLEAIVVGNA